MKQPGQTSLFIDSGGWIAINSAGDRHHAAARSFYREKVFSKYARLVTTNLVIAETYAVLLRARDRRAALEFLSLLDASTRINVVYSTPDLEDRARVFLVKYQDQQFSYCDAVSCAVMEELAIKEAFAFGRHFETAGFRRVP